jgi:hypothetical protein
MSATLVGGALGALMFAYGAHLAGYHQKKWLGISWMVLGAAWVGRAVTVLLMGKI